MLHRRRELPLPRPTAAPTATSSTFFLTGAPVSVAQAARVLLQMCKIKRQQKKIRKMDEAMKMRLSGVQNILALKLKREEAHQARLGPRGNPNSEALRTARKLAGTMDSLMGMLA